jgi:hypothetical protein
MRKKTFTTKAQRHTPERGRRTGEHGEKTKNSLGLAKPDYDSDLGGWQAKAPPSHNVAETLVCAEMSGKMKI